MSNQAAVQSYHGEDQKAKKHKLIRRKLRGSELRSEIVRKTLHMTIGFIPILSFRFSLEVTQLLLIAGSLTYIISELLRRRGMSVPVISKLTELASRNRDRGHFVVGPLTLGLGALLTISLFGEPAATIGILSLAFGDSFSSIIGKSYGRLKIRYSGGKTVEGALACFLSVFCATVFVIPNHPGKALLIAAVASLIEALPLRDWDNVALPLGTGLFTYILFL